MASTIARVSGWLCLLACALPAMAETCTTQSAMSSADRTALAAAATGFAARIAAGDAAGLRPQTIADLSGNYAGVESVVASTAPKLAGAKPAVEQVYVLDASTLAAPGDTTFDCTLNNSSMSAGFSIPQLPPGRYGFAMVRVEAALPWRLSFLMRQEGGQWKLAGLYPKPLTAAGHDGLWYWREARADAAKKQNWNAWLTYQEARSLLVPAGFVSSSHLDKLDGELQAAAPPAVASGITAEQPLVLTAADGAEFRLTSLGVDDSSGNPDVAMHLKSATLGDAATARARNTRAMSALVAAHPELRSRFHGVIVVTDAPGAAPYATASAMSEIQ